MRAEEELKRTERMPISDPDAIRAGIAIGDGAVWLGSYDGSRS